MSEGPIKAWRDGYKVPRASTARAHAICMSRKFPGKGYCGRKASAASPDWSKVTCADCIAAREADTGSSGAETAADPCKCHQNFAHVAPMHSGHCCFFPADQSCHLQEVAEWEAKRHSHESTDSGKGL